ncbi:hypothetical protein PGT21_016504 [Puccinia graminis f. sp. tritici]|uniref:Uncharacterized protein n=1 Tax=Puccinia graminis f. sp. tritici TaxID=56615 RepID=A0A5B0N5X8_PUCGR|nr:hypothetical protein PGT21_016504 [Puccinia graminis f. sp. tritici]
MSKLAAAIPTPSTQPAEPSPVQSTCPPTAPSAVRSRVVAWPSGPRRVLVLSYPVTGGLAIPRLSSSLKLYRAVGYTAFGCMGTAPYCRTHGKTRSTNSDRQSDSSLKHKSPRRVLNESSYDPRQSETNQAETKPASSVTSCQH